MGICVVLLACLQHHVDVLVKEPLPDGDPIAGNTQIYRSLVMSWRIDADQCAV